jgi:hypothetical protein
MTSLGGARQEGERRLAAREPCLGMRRPVYHDCRGASWTRLKISSFTVNGAAPPQNSALTSASAELHINANWTAIAKFDGEFASTAQTYSGTGTLKYSW